VCTVEEDFREQFQQVTSTKLTGKVTGESVVSTPRPVRARRGPSVHQPVDRVKITT
jgi:hypothetical protein